MNCWTPYLSVDQRNTDRVVSDKTTQTSTYIRKFHQNGLDNMVRGN